ncbi:hypothetical protein [Pseudomonas fluorescens]|uniref:hypothetical protein n=1 Tax=Pseudomonas fluorescens TaxID=294 RepID=UPI000F826620|nr:hypothetical protein [Pseudomonas fluorescens]
MGIGASFDFGIEINADRLAINCKASLVFGTGAGGGFGTAVDVEKIGDTNDCLAARACMEKRKNTASGPEKRAI